MPTVIDSFIVTLGLDPSEFTEGQRDMAQNLRSMEDTASRSAQNISRTTGRSIREFFGGFDAQFERVNKNLSDLGTGTRRTGSTIRAGSQEAAYGLSELAAAGLSAYAALKSVQGVYGELAKSVPATAGLGRLADLIGVNPQRLWTIAHAASSVTGASPEAVMGEIARLQEGRQAVAAGLPLPENLNTLSRFFNVDFQAPLETILTALETQAQNDPQALAKLHAAGFDALAPYLRRGPGAASAAEAAVAGYAPTSEQIGRAQELQRDTNLLTEAFGRLSRVMIDNAEPAIDSLFKTLIKGVDDVTAEFQHPRVNALGMPVGDPNNPLAPPLIGSSWWKRNMPTWLGGASATSQEGVEVPIQPGSGAARNGGGNAGALLGLGISPGSPEWAIAMRESRGNPTIGWSGLPGSPDYSPGGTDLSHTPLDSTGFPAWMGKMGPAGNSTAAGLFMITATNWHKYAPGLGIHDFSPESQYRVMQAMVAANRGYGDWAASGSTNFGITGAGISAAHLRSIQGANAGAIGNSSTHSISNDVDVNGGIHVYGADMRSGGAIGSAIANSLKQELLVNQSNTGQE